MIHRDVALVDQPARFGTFVVSCALLSTESDSVARSTSLLKASRRIGVRRLQWGETLHLVSDLDCDFLAFDAKYWCKSCRKDKHQAADALLQHGFDDSSQMYQDLAAAAARPYN